MRIRTGSGIFVHRKQLPHCKSCQFAEAANPSTLVCKRLKSIKDLLEPAVGLQLPVAVRKAEKMAGTFISPIDHPSEEFECLDCSIVTRLNEHGRCPRCGSNAVMQFMVLEKVGRWINIRDVRFWVPNDLPYEDGGPSAVLIPEKPQRSRTSVRRNAPVLTLAVEKRCA
jgi:hypothetical protein